MSHFSKFKSVFILTTIITLLFPSSAVNAITPTWTTNSTVGSDLSGMPPMTKYNTTRSEFAAIYLKDDLSGYMFTTSSVGTSWSSVKNVSPGAMGANNPLLTVDSTGAYYAHLGDMAGSVFGSSTNSGFSWATSTVGILGPMNSVTEFTTQGTTIFGAGSVFVMPNSLFALASSTNGGTSFASSTSAISSSSVEQISLEANANMVVGAYTMQGDTTHIYVATSANGTTFSTATITISDAVSIGALWLAIDSNDRIWISYSVTVGSTEYLEIATFKTGDAGSCIWNRERITTMGGALSGDGLGIAFLNGATPIITYGYTASLESTVKTVKYAVRDNGNSGCTGSGGSQWSCVDILTNYSTSNAAPSIVSNGVGKVVLTYSNSTPKAASADFLTTSYEYSCTPSTSSSSETTNTSFKTPVTPIIVDANSVIINEGATHITSREVSVVFNVDNASEMAISFNKELFGAFWEPYAKQKTLLLADSFGPQTLYAKFSNYSGGVSAITDSTIIFSSESDSAESSPSKQVPAEALPVSSPTPSISQTPSTPPTFEVITKVDAKPVTDRLEAMKNFIIEQKKQKEAESFSSAGSLVKLECPPDADTNHMCRAVYFVTSDGKRHAFPNEKIYNSWYSDFSGVQTVSSQTMASYSLGKNIQYRPGLLMIKFITNPKVYAVGKNGELRAIASEAVAKAMYGINWNTKIDDMSDAVLNDYFFGADINSNNQFAPLSETENVTSPLHNT